MGLGGVSPAAQMLSNDLRNSVRNIIGILQAECLCDPLAILLGLHVATCLFDYEGDSMI